MIQELSNGHSVLIDGKNINEFDFKKLSENDIDSTPNESDVGQTYQEQGEIIRLHQLSESIINLRDDNLSVGRSFSGNLDPVVDDASHDSLGSDCSIKVTISDPEPSSSLAVVQSVQKLKECSERAYRMTVSSPSHHIEFPKAGVIHYDGLGDDHEDNDQCRDNYVRSVTRFRSLLDDAFRRTVNGYNSTEKSKKRKVRYSEPIDDPTRQNRLNLMFRDINTEYHDVPVKNPTESATASLLKSKVAEILLLQNSLKESQEHANALSFANATLREASATAATRMERTTEALRIAGLNAANARADADAAIAKASALGTQVSSMKSTLADTKSTCDTIRDEHEAISKAAKQLEIRYLQLEAELSKADRDKDRLIQDKAELSDKYEKLYSSKILCDQTIDERTEEVKRLKKLLAERDDVEQVRVDRVHRIEIELREARALLSEATFVAAESESMTALLNETIKDLKNENKLLHDQITTILDNTAKERNRIQDELAQSERDAQKLRLKVTTHVEDIERMVLDKAESDREISSLKRQISELEKRLAVSTTISNDDKGFVSSHRNDSNGRLTTGRLSLGVTLPPIRPIVTKSASADSEKENSSESNVLSGKRLSLDSKASICCICHKASFGMMKSCQCGRPNCDKRAHALCLVNTNPLPSVSHPGTPAPMLPVILCHGTK